MPKQIVTLEVDFHPMDHEGDANELPQHWSWEAFADHYDECMEPTTNTLTRGVKVLSYAPVENLPGNTDEELMEGWHREYCEEGCAWKGCKNG